MNIQPNRPKFYTLRVAITPIAAIGAIVGAVYVAFIGLIPFFHLLETEPLVLRALCAWCVALFLWFDGWDLTRDLTWPPPQNITYDHAARSWTIADGDGHRDDARHLFTSVYNPDTGKFEAVDRDSLPTVRIYE